MTVLSPTTTVRRQLPPLDVLLVLLVGARRIWSTMCSVSRLCCSVATRS